MSLENFCPKCGHRVLPNEPFCTRCGRKTGYIETDDITVLVPPIHDIGFFNFSIDFSPYIERDSIDFEYEICSCGYLNEVTNEYCYMCGVKRTESKLSKILKHKSKPKYEMGNILCECGTVNPNENLFCEMCGRQLRDVPFKSNDNYSNFNLEFKDSVFCYCGEENERFSQFCRNCGRPLRNYGQSSRISILCTCSTINDAGSDFCVECGTRLNRENSLIICVCGHKNKRGLKFCEVCDRPLNPLKLIKTKIICSCGEILDWETDFCPNCGKNIKRTIDYHNSINKTIKNIKGILR